MNSPAFDVSFDMDDTLCALLGPSIALAQKMFGRQLKIPEYGHYFGWFPGQLTQDERQELLSVIYTPEFYLGLPSNFFAPHGVTVKKISQCANAHYRKIRVITSRGGALGGKAVDVTRKWLKLHEFEGADTIQIDAPDHNICKSTFCIEYPTVMVDDASHVADAFGADDRHRVILIDQHWNKGHPASRHVTRVPSRRLIEALVSNSK